MMICLGVCLCSNLQMYRSMKSDIGRQGIQCFVPFFLFHIYVQKHYPHNNCVSSFFIFHVIQLFQSYVSFIIYDVLVHVQ